MNTRAARAVGAGVTLLSAAAVLAAPRWLAVPGGLLLGLVLPGLALVSALFRGRTLHPIERTMVAPALSLAVLVGGGLIIDATGHALDRGAWTSATVTVTLAALLGPELPGGRAFLRSLPVRVRRAVPAAEIRRAPAAAPPAPAAGPPARPPVRRIAWQLLPMVLVVAVLGSAGWLSVADARRAADVPVTALSAGPPSAVTSGRRFLRVTASGLVAADGPYALVVTDAGGRHRTRRTIAVPPSGSWTDSLTLRPERTTIALYRAGDTTAYRTLSIAAAQP